MNIYVGAKNKNGAEAPLLDSALMQQSTVQLGRHLVGKIHFLYFDAFAHFKANERSDFGAGSRDQLANRHIGVLDEGLLNE